MKIFTVLFGIIILSGWMNPTGKLVTSLYLYGVPMKKLGKLSKSGIHRLMGCTTKVFCHGISVSLLKLHVRLVAMEPI